MVSVLATRSSLKECTNFRPGPASYVYKTCFSQVSIVHHENVIAAGAQVAAS